MRALRTGSILAAVALECAALGVAACGPQRAVRSDSAVQSPPPVAHALSLEGMVVSAEPHATRVGAGILGRGGNAIDAAVATALALAVTFPQAGNLGGGGFLVYVARDGTRAALDFRETAPAAADRSMYATGAANRSLYGALAAGVPGSVAGLAEAHRRFGRLAWSEVVAPAIGLAEGFEVEAPLEAALKRIRARIDPLAAASPAPYAATLDTFFPGGNPPPVGSTFRQLDLAATLERIAKGGADGFYRGRTAELLVAEMQRDGGLITLDDLAGYTALWRVPLTFDYRGHTVITMPPASSGGATLAELANLMEGFAADGLPADSAERAHRVAEAARRAFADRNAYLGDPAFVEMPIERMISEDYAALRGRSFSADSATPSRDVGPGLGSVPEGSDTTHVSVVDADGTAVALTTTINTSFGSLVTVRGAGFLLNNEMDDFAARPGEPNAYGLVQGEANAIAAGKRMASSMTPTVVLDPQGRLRLVLGSPGGPRITTAVAQVMFNVIDLDLGAAEALAAPRVHHQHLPDRLYVERGGFSDAAVARLRALGHVIELVDALGEVQAVVVDREGLLWGAADPRGSGLALGR